MPNGGLGGGVAMANEQRKQLSRVGGARGGRGLPSINLPRQPGEPLEEEDRGAKRQLSRQGQLGGTVGRGRSLAGGGLVRRVGKGLGNRSLGRFRRPQ